MSDTNHVMPTDAPTPTGLAADEIVDVAPEPESVAGSSSEPGATQFPLDEVAAAAVEEARAAVESDAPGLVGAHLGATADDARVVTHYFATLDPAYRGWRWAVTVARASRSKTVTIDDVVLLPGDDALLAPEWVPWSERLRPGDLGVGDLLPDGGRRPTAGAVLPHDR